jgi:hypothetical protein
LEHRIVRGGGQIDVFYLPSQNIFYVAAYDLSTNSFPVRGPFAGPRLELKKLIEGAKEI